MGFLQSWHLSLHKVSHHHNLSFYMSCATVTMKIISIRIPKYEIGQMCGVPQKHGGAGEQDQASQTGPVGGQPSGQDERGEIDFEETSLLKH